MQYLSIYYETYFRVRSNIVDSSLNNIVDSSLNNIVDSSLNYIVYIS